MKEDFEIELENQRKLLEEKLLDPEDIQNALLKWKLFNDTFSQFADLPNTINKLVQYKKRNFTKQRTAIINQILDIINRSNF